ncbi:prepilin-type N-terminal cleavage/methylation domain-containing protein [Oleiharenicola sp. Vm1]|uniref:prepilin-type N-terminal cleavage/methylation domain-containing protein n=1 Tax=Oleiharenicola sp. Vm1 TaxID=3398393 RepID=UPI0039F58978
MKTTQDNTSRSGGIRRLRSAKGYTLIEVLLVTLIIGGIIAAIGIPTFNTIRQNNRVDSTYTMLQTYANAVSQFDQMSNGSVYPLTVAATTADVTANTTGALLQTASVANFSNAARFDQVLVGAGLINAFFSPAMGNQTRLPTGWTTTSQDLIWSPTARTFSLTTDTATPAHNWSPISRLICQASAPATAPNTAAGANFRLDGSTNLPSGVRVVSAVIRGCNATDAYLLAQKYNPQLVDATAAGSAQTRGRVVWATPSSGVCDVYVYLGQQ